MTGLGANPAPPCYSRAMSDKIKPQPDEIEELPDAWERFEKAFDTVMKAKPKPRSAKAKERPASKGRVHKGKTRSQFRLGIGWSATSC